MLIPKSDRDGITLLILIIIVAILLYHYVATDNDEATSAPVPQKLTEGDAVASPPNGPPVPFDPNTADSATLLRMGLYPWQIRNVMKYRARGGYYRQKEDFAQLYGLEIDQYRKLEPYIRIVPKVMAADVIKRPLRQRQTRKQYYVSEPSSKSVQTVDGADASPKSLRHTYYYQQKLSPGETVDANTADTTELKRIPGIGSYFARRIVALRQRRKQFVNKEELLTIRNFPEDALAYITLSHNYEPIHINQMTQRELEHHPLLNYLQAREIIRLRNTSGPIRSIDDMSLMSSFRRGDLEKIAPFIVF